MKIISHDHIQRLAIRPQTCMEWVRESFLLKAGAQLPAKISLHPQGSDFFNTMPCLLPERFHRFGVKVVHRIEGAQPTLGGDILLYDAASGELKAMLDGDWITTMRTGAVAALAAQLFRRRGDLTYGFIGLGNTARATLLCLLASEADRHFHVKLLRYKDQAESFKARFARFDNVSFETCETPAGVVGGSDVVFSCLTNAETLLCPDNTLFREGCLIVPVHTKGFQNCDLFFDRIFADDRAHVCGFRYFDRFRHFAELADVFTGTTEGRTSDTERLLSYNIGLGLHDVLFAHKIYEMAGAEAPEVKTEHPSAKFWI